MRLAMNPFYRSLCRGMAWHVVSSKSAHSRCCMAMPDYSFIHSFTIAPELTFLSTFTASDSEFAVSRGMFMEMRSASLRFWRHSRHWKLYRRKNKRSILCFGRMQSNPLVMAREYPILAGFSNNKGGVHLEWWTITKQTAHVVAVMLSCLLLRIVSRYWQYLPRSCWNAWYVL